MSTLNIESLLQDLEEEVGMTKAASASAAEEKPSLSEELEGMLTKQASIEAAAESGKSLAKSILEKMANEIITETASMVADQDATIKPTVEVETETVEDTFDNLIDRALESGAIPEDKAQTEATETTESGESEHAKTAETILEEGTDMAKEAELIEKIAQAVIEKLASEAENLPAPANMIQEDTATMVAQHDAAIQPMPGAGGTLNQILDAIVADAKAKGAIAENTVASGESHAAAEGANTTGEAVEKAAAVSALVEAGVDFDEAVEMVKQAEVEIQSEARDLEKKAAFSALLESGVDFDEAVKLVKEAAEKVYGK